MLDGRGQGAADRLRAGRRGRGPERHARCASGTPLYQAPEQLRGQGGDGSQRPVRARAGAVRAVHRQAGVPRRGARDTPPCEAVVRTSRGLNPAVERSSCGAWNPTRRTGRGRRPRCWRRCPAATRSRRRGGGRDAVAANWSRTRAKCGLIRPWSASPVRGRRGRVRRDGGVSPRPPRSRSPGGPAPSTRRRWPGRPGISPDVGLPDSQPYLTHCYFGDPRCAPRRSRGPSPPPDESRPPVYQFLPARPPNR